MTANSANCCDCKPSPMQVVVVIYPDIFLLDLAGPLAVFSWAKERGDGALGYKVAITSLPAAASRRTRP